MTHILIIDPDTETIIHNIPIESKDSAKTMEKFCKDQEAARGHELERVIISMKTVRIMDRQDPVPVPAFSSRVQVQP